MKWYCLNTVLTWRPIRYVSDEDEEDYADDGEGEEEEFEDEGDAGDDKVADTGALYQLWPPPSPRHIES